MNIYAWHYRADIEAVSGAYPDADDTQDIHTIAGEKAASFQLEIPERARRCLMETTASGGRSFAIVLTWLITVIALALTTWVLVRLGGHAAVIGIADPKPAGSANAGGLPWG
jgi:hypothetical protein